MRVAFNLYFSLIFLLLMTFFLVRKWNIISVLKQTNIFFAITASPPPMPFHWLSLPIYLKSRDNQFPNVIPNVWPKLTEVLCNVKKKSFPYLSAPSLSVSPPHRLQYTSAWFLCSWVSYLGPKLYIIINLFRVSTPALTVPFDCNKKLN